MGSTIILLGSGGTTVLAANSSCGVMLVRHISIGASTLAHLVAKANLVSFDAAWNFLLQKSESIVASIEQTVVLPKSDQGERRIVLGPTESEVNDKVGELRKRLEEVFFYFAMQKNCRMPRKLDVYADFDRLGWFVEMIGSISGMPLENLSPKIESLCQKSNPCPFDLLEGAADWEKERIRSLNDRNMSFSDRSPSVAQGQATDAKDSQKGQDGRVAPRRRFKLRRTISRSGLFRQEK